MPDYLGDDMRKTKKDEPETEEKEIKCKISRLPYRSRSYFKFCTLSIRVYVLVLDEADIALLKTYVSSLSFHSYSYQFKVTNRFFIKQGQGQYTKQIKTADDEIQSLIKRVNELTGIKESDTGLAPPALWDLTADKQTLQNEQPLQVEKH